MAQYLTFLLAGEQYGVEILRVREIRGYTPVRPIPGMPAEVKGVISLRGTVIPVVDLRARFAMPAFEATPVTVIIVVTIGTQVVGLLADAVSDVLEVDARDVQPAPALAGDVSFLRGVAQTAERLVLLLELDAVIAMGPAAGSPTGGAEPAACLPIETPAPADTVAPSEAPASAPVDTTAPIEALSPAPADSTAPIALVPPAPADAASAPDGALHCVPVDPAGPISKAPDAEPAGVTRAAAGGPTARRTIARPRPAGAAPAASSRTARGRRGRAAVAR